MSNSDYYPWLNPNAYQPGKIGLQWKCIAQQLHSICSRESELHLNLLTDVIRDQYCTLIRKIQAGQTKWLVNLARVVHEALAFKATMLNQEVWAGNGAKHNKKAVRLMAQLIKFYKFYYLLYLNKRWLNSQ